MPIPAALPPRRGTQKRQRLGEWRQCTATKIRTATTVNRSAASRPTPLMSMGIVLEAPGLEQCHPARTGQPLSGVRACAGRGIHRYGEHRSRALRSETVSSGERGAARRVPQRPGSGAIGEEAHSRVMRPSLRRLIVRERFHPNAQVCVLGPRLGRVKGSLRRCAPLTRPARSRFVAPTGATGSGRRPRYA
jgi:hypothetical protein